LAQDIAPYGRSVFLITDDKDFGNLRRIGALGCWRGVLEGGLLILYIASDDVRDIQDFSKQYLLVNAAVL
jgi:hypothetical protein